jgi:hypothetical protein
VTYNTVKDCSFALDVPESSANWKFTDANLVHFTIPTMGSILTGVSRFRVKV